MKDFTVCEHIVKVGNVKNKLSFQGSANSETVRFIVDRYCGDTDLLQCQCIIKTKNSDAKADIIYPELSEDGDRLFVIWKVTSATTSLAGILQAQLEFDWICDDSSQNVIWQSNIMEFEIQESLSSDDEVYDQDPSLFQQWEKFMAASADSASASADSAAASAASAKTYAEQAQQVSSNQPFANAFLGNASGMAVALQDVQPGTAFPSLCIKGCTSETGEGEKSPQNPYTLEGTAKVTVSDSDYTIPQLSVSQVVGNGNFSADGNGDGLADGFTLRSTAQAVSCLNNTQVFIATGAYGKLYKSDVFLAGHKYFFIADVKADAASTIQLSVIRASSGATKYVYSGFHPGDNQYHSLFVLTDIDSGFTPANAGIEDARTSEWTNISLRNFMAIDMGTDSSHPLYNLSASAMENLVNQMGYFENDGIISVALYSLPNGVTDDFNAATGTGTRKTGLLTFHGEEKETYVFSEAGTGISSLTAFFELTMTVPPKSDSAECSRLVQQTTDFLWASDAAGFSVNPANPGSGCPICLRIPKTLLSGWSDTWSEAQKTEALRAWLSTNPVAFLYELSEPGTFSGPAQDIPAAASCSLSAGGAELEVSYYRDSNAVLQELQQQIAALSAAN